MGMPAMKLPDAEEFDEATLDRVARSIRYLVAERERQPSLEEAARFSGLSPSHFQRVFTRHVGISPKRFVGFLTLQAAKEELETSAPLLDAAFAVGLSGPSRLHDLFVSYEAMTPGEFKERGAGLDLSFGFASTPFGRLICIASARGIVGLAFADADAGEDVECAPVAAEGEDLWGARASLEDMKERWPRAQYRHDNRPAELVASALFGLAGTHSPQLHLVLSGTNFQVRVWEALLRMAPGTTTTYQSLANGIEAPEATRAVASAVGRNPISLLIPCHRVLRSDGGLGGYHWGLTRKRALLAWEKASSQSTSGRP